MNPRNPVVLAICSIAACSPDGAGTGETPSSLALAVSAPGAIPGGLPRHLMVGLDEGPGQTWMAQSGVPWDARYTYFTKGWVCNWGWDKACSGSWGLSYLKEGGSKGYLPTVAYYVMNGEPGGGEGQFLAKVQTPATMADYFGDFKVMMQVAKQYGKPVLIVLEPDGWGYLESQSGANPNAYAAVAASGVPELAGLPNTVAGFGMAFLQLRKAIGATNAILTVHVSAWADGNDVAYFDVADALGPHVDTVYKFLSPLGLGANQTGTTFDLLSGDPLDRDSDYYALVENQNRWWDASDTATIYTKSFNRYAAWLQLWNQKAGKRWVLWQIPLGNSNHLDVCNNGGSRQGYKDNRAEYFFAGAPSGDTRHLVSWAQDGVIGLLFGAGAGCQSSFQNDVYSDGQLFMKSRVGAFYAGGGLPLGGTGPAPDAGTGADASSGAPDAGTGADASSGAPDTAQYGFESGAQGWAPTGGMIQSAAASPAQAFAGTSSLAVRIAGSGTQQVYVSSPAAPAGATVTFHVWVPSGSGLSWIQPYVQQGAAGSWTWTGDWQSITSLRTDAWNTLAVTVPGNAATPLYQLGVQFSASASWSGTVYVDSVGW
jgi:hypothetical protein